MNTTLRKLPTGKAAQIWYEMARRKIQFHKGEKWDQIRLWGLFQWGEVSKYLKAGKLKTDMRKENKIIWVTPSTETYETYIEPILEEYEADRLTLEEISSRAGW